MTMSAGIKVNDRFVQDKPISHLCGVTHTFSISFSAFAICPICPLLMNNEMKKMHRAMMMDGKRGGPLTPSLSSNLGTERELTCIS